MTEGLSRLQDFTFALDEKTTNFDSDSVPNGTPKRALFHKKREKTPPQKMFFFQTAVGTAFYVFLGGPGPRKTAKTIGGLFKIEVWANSHRCLPEVHFDSILGVI